MDGTRRLILYVGSSRRGAALAAAVAGNDWHVYSATEPLEALALYAFYWPHMVVVDAGSEGAGETYFHLASVDARVVLVGADRDTTATWQTQPGSLIPVIASNATDDDVIAALEDIFRLPYPTVPAIASDAEMPDRWTHLPMSALKRKSNREV